MEATTSLLAFANCDLNLESLFAEQTCTDVQQAEQCDADIEFLCSKESAQPSRSGSDTQLFCPKNSENVSLSSKCSCFRVVKNCHE